MTCSDVEASGLDVGGLLGLASHFTCVAEAAPHEEPLCSVVGALAPHVHHIHARVGYSDGPQARSALHQNGVQGCDIALQAQKSQTPS